MKIFVTGATGFIGSKLALKLAEEGFTVHALYRSKEKTKNIKHKNILLFKGDILEKHTIYNAVHGCEQVYHVAGYIKSSLKDNSLIYRMNIDGAVNVIEASIEKGVKKMVLTSTAGVFGDSANGAVSEKNIPDNHFGDYENSKVILEQKALNFCKNGFPIIIVNPTRVFGPGLLGESNSVTRMIDKYRCGKWHFIPGNGQSIGNYVYIDDVVAGHILAMENGKPGERYILGGDNISYNDFFEILAEQSDKKNWMVNVPISVLLPVASTILFFANHFSFNPMITPYHIKKLTKNFKLDLTKAKAELGYNPLSFQDGLMKTLNWLKMNNI